MRRDRSSVLIVFDVTDGSCTIVGMHDPKSNIDRFVIVLAILATLTSSVIAVFGDWPRETISTFTIIGWVISQSFLLTIPGMLAGLLLRRRLPRIASWFGAMLILIVPMLMLLDAIAFRWIGDRLLSQSMWRITTELRSGLLGHVTASMISGAVLLLVACSLIGVTLAWGSIRVAGWWFRRRPSIGPRAAIVLCGSIALALSAPSLIDFRTTQAEMAEHSTRHPLCVIGAIPFRGVGDPLSAGVETWKTFRSMEQAVVQRDQKLRQLSISDSESDLSSMPDVVVVVVESFRRELVDPEVMPNLWALARKGIHCRNHFSGGNATSHGMFSLFNGLEAIWHERPIRFSPLLNRLFRSARYEVGFFAGHDHWREFYMDGFITEEQFDVFEIAPHNGLSSDRRATELASMFLDGNSTASREHRPRLAILYLYATHATYTSYPEDQLFQPAADDRFVYPYAESSQRQVWNRYKNSAHTVDRFLSAVLKDNRVVIVTGDHGEAFLEDGTIGHGIRISEYQNMTPAVVYVPGCEPRVIESPTSHADLLPTLLAAVGLRVSDDSTFDGVDLRAAADESLSDRIFVTRNYLHDDVALIGPWTIQDDGPFAYRVDASLTRMSVGELNAIDRYGYEQEIDIDDMTAFSMVLGRWAMTRFGPIQDK